MKTTEPDSSPQTPEDSLSKRVVSGAIVLLILMVVLWAGLPLILPTLVFILWAGTAELEQMLSKRGIALNIGLLRWGGLLMLASSLPHLHYAWPEIPWREVSTGLVLVGSFSYELIRGANIQRFAYSMMAFMYLPWTLGYFLLLRYAPNDTLGIWTLSLPLIATFATDVGAFFVGKHFGRHQLAPSISPNKTVEGSIGGMLVSFLALLLYTQLVHKVFPFGFVELIVVSLLLSVAAQLGDLTESMLKRYCGVKDSGSFLPGHGGLLDRMDSLLFSVPLMYYLLVLFT